MKEAKIISSKIEFGKLQPELDGRPMDIRDIEFLGSIAAHLAKANGWRTDNSSNPLLSVGYLNAIRHAGRLAYDCGMLVPSTLIDPEIDTHAACAALKKLRGQPAAWSALVLQLWMFLTNREDTPLFALCEAVQKRGERER